jgi:hypothetical protein
MSDRRHPDEIALMAASETRVMSFIRSVTQASG